MYSEKKRGLMIEIIGKYNLKSSYRKQRQQRRLKKIGGENGGAVNDIIWEGIMKFQEERTSTTLDVIAKSGKEENWKDTTGW